MKENNDWKELVLWLRERMQELNISQEQLAEMCGMPQSSISRIFNMKFSPTLKVVTLIASKLGIEVDFKKNAFFID